RSRRTAPARRSRTRRQRASSGSRRSRRSSSRPSHGAARSHERHPRRKGPPGEKKAHNRHTVLSVPADAERGEERDRRPRGRRVRPLPQWVGGARGHGRKGRVPVTLWAARTGVELAPEVWEFLKAEDAELLPYDCEGTRIHARRLAAAGLLTGVELA